MYAKNFELKKRILGNARMDAGSSYWEDHFLAVSIVAKTDTGESVDVMVSARMWSEAHANLTRAERLALLTLVTGKNVVDYEIPVENPSPVYYQLFG